MTKWLTSMYRLVSFVYNHDKILPVRRVGMFSVGHVFIDGVSRRGLHVLRVAQGSHRHHTCYPLSIIINKVSIGLHMHTHLLLR
jgi:hypothetical protein